MWTRLSSGSTSTEIGPHAFAIEESAIERVRHRLRGTSFSPEQRHRGRSRVEIEVLFEPASGADATAIPGRSLERLDQDASRQRRSIAVSSPASSASTCAAVLAMKRRSRACRDVGDGPHHSGLRRQPDLRPLQLLGDEIRARSQSARARSGRAIDGVPDRVEILSFERRASAVPAGTAISTPAYGRSNTNRAVRCRPLSRPGRSGRSPLA